MTGATVAPALQFIAEEFSDQPNVELLTKLLLTLPSLSIALLAPISGIIIDAFGRKKLLIISLFLYTITGFSAFLMGNLTTILISRVVLGIATAGVMTSLTTLIADNFINEARNKFLGIQAAFIAIFGIFLLTTSGWLADINWRTPFFIYLSPLLFIPLCIKFISEPKNTEAHESINTNNGYSIKTVALIYFVTFWGLIFFFLVPTQIPFLAGTYENISGFKIGLIISCATLGGAFSSLLFKTFTKHLNYNLIYVIVFLLNGIGYIIIATTPSISAIITGLLFSGFGFGLMMPNTNLWLMNIAPFKHRGKLIGGLTTAFFLGQFLSPVFAEPVKQSFTLSGTFLISGCIMIAIALFFGAKAIIDKH